TVTVLSNDETQYRYQAFFGRLNYNWEQRYILNFTARRDGSSRFGPGKQFANFGAIGAAWLFSNESFLKNSRWLSFGKIRASYGTTGNDQIGDYQFLNTYTTTGIQYNGIVGLQPSRLFNADFGWEINKKLEFAIESGFCNDRIFTTVAWYQNKSSNQLVGIPLPGTTGFTSVQANLDAIVENKGLEFTLRTINFNKGNFHWSTNFNLSFSRNKLLSFPSLESSTYNQKYRIGKPLNIALVYKSKGVNPQTGIYEFEDLNNDGRISFPADRQVTVDLNPQYFGGLQNQLSYKHWNLDFLFQFVKQKNRLVPMSPAGMMSNQQARISNTWIKAGDIAEYQIATTGYNSAAVNANSNYGESDAMISDASYIRLKNISLTYELPLNLKESGIKIMLQGQNLLTFTKFKEGDPEFMSYGFLPPLKIMSLGAQLNF
ncbi:SusC/RagA family TonB-linked outer membrane protein, partial [Flavobacterium sp. HMWF030]